MTTYKKICPNCKGNFDTKKKGQIYCKKPCYYKFSAERLKVQDRERRKMIRENKQFPKYVTESGREIQLDFDPIKDWDKFVDLKTKNP